MKRVLLVIFAALIFVTADAAVTPNSPVTMQSTSVAFLQFLQGTDSAGTYKTLYTGTTDTSRCVALQTDNTDTAATHLLTIQVVHSGVKYGGTSLTTVSPASAAALAPVLITSVAGWVAANASGAPIWPEPRDTDGNDYVPVGNGDTLQATFATNLSAAAVINLRAVCGNF